MQTRTTTFIAILACCAASTPLLPHETLQPKPAGQTGPVLGKPLSATETHTTQTVLSDGTQSSHTATGSFYRDAQGRMRVECSSDVVIYDPVAGFFYRLHPQTRTYGEHSVSASASMFIAVTDEGVWTDARDHAHDHAGAAGAKNELPSVMVDGHKARGARVETTIPAGAFGNDHPLKSVDERWYSDELGVLLKSSNSDPRFGTATYELTKIVLGPPDPALFRVPAGYTLEGGKAK